MSFVYNNIKRIAKEGKMSLSVLAGKIGMTSTGFHQMVSNDTMKVATLFKIAEVFNVDVQIIMMKDFVQYQENTEAAMNMVNEPAAQYGSSSQATRVQYLTKRIEQIKAELKVKDKIIEDQKKLIDEFDNKIVIIK